MAAIKIVRRNNKQRKDGTAPLALRISKDYKTNYQFLDQYVLAKDWDKNTGTVKRSHPNSVRLNNYLRQRLTEAENIMFNANDLSSQVIKRKVSGKRKRSSFFAAAADRVQSKFDKGVFSVAKSELSILYNIEFFLNCPKSGSVEKIKADIQKQRKDRIGKAIKGKYSYQEGIQYFRNINSLSFEDITLSFLDRYKAFCTKYLDQSTRTITNQLIFIRTLFNSAIKDGLVDAKHYPFGGENEVIRIKRSQKIGLTAKEIKRIEKLKFEEGSSLWHTHNSWLISFYFAGIRISDVIALKWSDFKDGRLYYVMHKNEKPVSLKIPKQAQLILSGYKKEKGHKDDYVFPFLKGVDQKNKRKLFTKTRNATSLFNTNLKKIANLAGIDKNLSNHIARHSFGNIAGDKINPLMLQKLYRHSDLKTTINYQANFIHRDADDALDTVLNL